MRWQWMTTMATTAVAGLFLTACEPAEQDAPGDSASAQLDEDFELQGDPASGQEVFARQCVSCHGREGQGDGPAGAALNPAPTDFTSTDLQPAETFRVIRDGGAATDRSAVMPAFDGPLEEQQLHDVTAYVLSLSEGE